MTADEEEQIGAQAIVTLQAYAGIEETPEQAAAGWRSMTPEDRRTTHDAYSVVILGVRPGGRDL